jgi:hypothetical protein
VFRSIKSAKATRSRSTGSKPGKAGWEGDYGIHATSLTGANGGFGDLITQSSEVRTAAMHRRRGVQGGQDQPLDGVSNPAVDLGRSNGQIGAQLPIRAARHLRHGEGC